VCVVLHTMARGVGELDGCLGSGVGSQSLLKVLRLTSRIWRWYSYLWVLGRLYYTPLN
jgi:hypothetical protein